MEIYLREFTEEDIPEIHSIELSSYPKPWTMNFFRLMANMNPGLFIVATIDEKLVGYIVGEVNERKGCNVGHVMNVAVAPRHRKKGIGTKLMDELEARFRRLGAVTSYLEVRESNLDAQRLYSRRGYLYLRKVEGYYGDEDGLVMIKSLDR